MDVGLFVWMSFHVSGLFYVVGPFNVDCHKNMGRLVFVDGWSSQVGSFI